MNCGHPELIHWSIDKSSFKLTPCFGRAAVKKHVYEIRCVIKANWLTGKPATALNKSPEDDLCNIYCRPVDAVNRSIWAYEIVFVDLVVQNADVYLRSSNKTWNMKYNKYYYLFYLHRTCIHAYTQYLVINVIALDKICATMANDIARHTSSSIDMCLHDYGINAPIYTKSVIRFFSKFFCRNEE